MVAYRWYFGKPVGTHGRRVAAEPAGRRIQQAKTPLLLLQGESDTTDPLGQSQEMYRALRQDGVPVELVAYPQRAPRPPCRGHLRPTGGGAVAWVRRAAADRRVY